MCVDAWVQVCEMECNRQYVCARVCLRARERECIGVCEGMGEDVSVVGVEA